MVLRPGDAPAVGGPPSSSATTRPREPSDGLIRSSRGRVLDRGLGGGVRGRGRGAGLRRCTAKSMRMMSFPHERRRRRLR